MDVDPEMPDLAQLADLFGRKKELGHIPKVLTHSPGDLARIDAGLVPLQKLPGCRYILGDGLLRKDMLAREESSLDEFRLNQDREACWCLISLKSGCHRDE